MACRRSTLDHRAFPPTPSKWPRLRFVPSRSVHILYSDLKPPQQPVTNYSGPGLQAYTSQNSAYQSWGAIMTPARVLKLLRTAAGLVESPRLAERDDHRQV